MTDEHRSADATAARTASGAEERRLARRALAGRARDAADLALLMDMLDLEPGRDPDRDAAPGPGRPAAAPGRGRGTGRERRQTARRDTCRGARTPSADPG